jgi:hypothetical protein
MKLKSELNETGVFWLQRRLCPVLERLGKEVTLLFTPDSLTFVQDTNTTQGIRVHAIFKQVRFDKNLCALYRCCPNDCTHACTIVRTLICCTNDCTNWFCSLASRVQDVLFHIYGCKSQNDDKICIKVNTTMLVRVLKSIEEGFERCARVYKNAYAGQLNSFTHIRALWVLHDHGILCPVSSRRWWADLCILRCECRLLPRLRIILQSDVRTLPNTVMFEYPYWCDNNGIVIYSAEWRCDLWSDALQSRATSNYRFSTSTPRWVRFPQMRPE